MTRDHPSSPGLNAVRGDACALIVDLWGCLHDGVTPYPGAVACLLAARDAGLAVLLLSNAPRPVSAVLDKLDGMGVPRHAYDHVLTSGEMTRHALGEGVDAFHAGLGQRMWHLGPARDEGVWRGLRFEPVAGPQDAQWVLNTGIDRAQETVADHAPAMRVALQRGLPMVCANPDRIVGVGGRLQICAGELAAWYAAQGGTVVSHGKPLPSVYMRAFALLGQPAPCRVLAIGDGPHTDIRGGADAGCRTVLLTGGILHEQLGGSWGAAPDEAQVRTLLRAESAAQPDVILPALRW